MSEHVPFAPYARDRYHAVAAHPSGLATAAMICGILGILVTLAAVSFFLLAVLIGPIAFIFALLAIFLGHIALGQIRRSQGALTGGGIAITGLILGYITLVLSILVTIFGVVLLVSSPQVLPLG